MAAHVWRLNKPAQPQRTAWKALQINHKKVSELISAISSPTIPFAENE